MAYAIGTDGGGTNNKKKKTTTTNTKQTLKEQQMNKLDKVTTTPDVKAAAAKPTTSTAAKTATASSVAKAAKSLLTGVTSLLSKGSSGTNTSVKKQGSAVVKTPDTKPKGSSYSPGANSKGNTNVKKQGSTVVMKPKLTPTGSTGLSAYTPTSQALAGTPGRAIPTPAITPYAPTMGENKITPTMNTQPVRAPGVNNALQTMFGMSPIRIGTPGSNPTLPPALTQPPYAQGQAPNNPTQMPGGTATQSSSNYPYNSGGSPQGGYSGGNNVVGGGQPQSPGQPQGEQPQGWNIPDWLNGVPAWNGNPQQQVEQSAIDAGGIMDMIGEMWGQYAGQSDEHAAAMAAQYTQMVDMLDALEAQIIGQIQGQMSGEDPGLQAAIGVIKEEAARMRDQSLEELNARGLVQSGVYAEMLDRLNKNELTGIQQAVAGQFSDLQTQLNNALMSLAQARIGALSGHQNQLNSMLINDRNVGANMNMQGIGYGLEAQGQQNQNRQYYTGLGQQWNLAQMNDATQRYGIDTSNALQQQQIDINREQLNRPSGSGGISPSVQLDRDIWDYNVKRESEAALDGAYNQMGSSVMALATDERYTRDQKIAMINTARFPKEVIDYGLNLLNTLDPPPTTNDNRLRGNWVPGALSPGGGTNRPL